MSFAIFIIPRFPMKSILWLFITSDMIFIYRNTMQACGYGKTALSLGIMELISRLVMAFVSIKIGSYALAVAGDAAAWFSTGIFSWLLYLFLMKRLKERRRVSAQ